MKECFVITTYCSNPERVDELKKCINNLKQFNADVLIHAHYPLDADVQNLANYYIYDSSNPVIRDGSKIIVRWKWYFTAHKLLTMPNPDYSYAVMNQWKSSLKFLEEKSYDIVHIINYDTFINKFVYDLHVNALLENDAVFEYTHYKPKDYNAKTLEEKSNLIFIVFMSIKKTFINSFVNELTIEKYLNSKDTMLETYIMEVLAKFENQKYVNSSVGFDPYKIKKLYDTEFKLYLGDAVVNPLKKEECDVYTTISEANGFDIIKNDLCFVFGGNNHEFNKFEILLFEITKQIDEIIICIYDDITKVNNITDKYYSLITQYSIEEIVKVIDEGKLSITINGEKVKDEVINMMRYQGIQPKFE